MKLSKHLSLSEATFSRTAKEKGIDNTPNEKVIKALKNIAENIFDPCREFIGAPLGINSGYRSVELNRAIKGATTSQHIMGEALDIDVDVYRNGKNSELFHFIKDNLDFDQLIWEYGTDEEPSWVHVSLKANGRNRKRVMRKRYGTSRYENYVR